MQWWVICHYPAKVLSFAEHFGTECTSSIFVIDGDLILQRSCWIRGRAVSGTATSNCGCVCLCSYMASLQAKPAVDSGMDCCRRLFGVCTSVCRHEPCPDERLWTKEQEAWPWHRTRKQNEHSVVSTNSIVLPSFYTNIHYQIFIEIMFLFSALQVWVDCCLFEGLSGTNSSSWSSDSSRVSGTDYVAVSFSFCLVN